MPTDETTPPTDPTLFYGPPGLLPANPIGARVRTVEGDLSFSGMVRCIHAESGFVS